MSYTRERKVTTVAKDFLVWLPQGSDLPLDAGIADSASLAEAGLCSAEELRRLRSELQAAMCEVDRLHSVEENAKSAEAELARVKTRLAEVIDRGRMDLYHGKPSDPKVWTFTSKCCSVCNAAGPLHVTALGREDMYIALCDACLAKMAAEPVAAEREACAVVADNWNEDGVANDIRARGAK